MKREDITTKDVLEAYEANWIRKPDGELDSFNPARVYIPVEQRLAKQFNVAINTLYTSGAWKPFWRAMEREYDKNYIEYGINLRAGWLTPKGYAKLQEIRHGHTN